jgi:hypothetical protein
VIRLSRPCYDKYHRCPGWAGGGWKWPKGESRCNGGHLKVDWEKPYRWHWKFHRCDTCNVLAFPYMAHWLSPGWYKFKVEMKVEDLKFWWHHR